ncbi:DJ-1/PfpI family protein [Actinoplanes sp. LDG1-06]|uniref:DJ-1/PfpI family protein n=1 Tax=Paractinoplanes ovalisporus TaxID=2810368 RepID=A0ABS2AUP4_9ACTN|nr:DJ-1/PfpI family protein [Actinoplanes ovalisporus]MBM2623577.1 DJ-1/PfpI family protein [Actinoplanes ovalisporus]
MERRTLFGAAAVAGVAAAGLAAEPASATKGRRWSPDNPMRVQIVMFDGVEEQDFAGPFDVFSLADRQSGGAVKVGYVTPAEPRTITAAWGTQVVIPTGWSPSDADVIVVPGGGFGRPDGPGVWAEIKSGVLPRKLADAADGHRLVASFCTGVIVVAAAGLVTGRPATTHQNAKAELARRGGTVVDARVVDDRDLVTAAGVTSGLDLALHLVRREISAAVAVRVENILEYQARGTVWTP